MVGPEGGHRGNPFGAHAGRRHYRNSRSARPPERARSKCERAQLFIFNHEPHGDSDRVLAPPCRAPAAPASREQRARRCEAPHVNAPRRSIASQRLRVRGWQRRTQRLMAPSFFTRRRRKPRLTGPCCDAAPLEPGAAGRAMEPGQPAPRARHEKRHEQSRSFVGPGPERKPLPSIAVVGRAQGENEGGGISLPGPFRGSGIAPSSGGGVRGRYCVQGGRGWISTELRRNYARRPERDSCWALSGNRRSVERTKTPHENLCSRC